MPSPRGGSQGGRSISVPNSQSAKFLKSERYMQRGENPTDRKSTRLNSSHTVTSYAVFCLKKKKKTRIFQPYTIRQTTFITISPVHSSNLTDMAITMQHFTSKQQMEQQSPTIAFEHAQKFS